jgi:hypothetical protein
MKKNHLFVGVSIQKPLWQEEKTCLLSIDSNKVLPLSERPLS